MKSGIIASLSPDQPILVDEEAYRIDPMVFEFGRSVLTFETFDAQVESIQMWAEGTEDLCVHGTEAFACRDASCRPPTSGGTGGSRKKGAPAPSAGGTTGRGLAFKATSDADLDLLFPGRRDAGNKTVNPDGTFSVEGLDAKGNPTRFSDKTEAAIAEQWAKIGPSREQYVANFEVAGKLAMGIDPATGKVVDAKRAAEGHHDSKWYTVAHQDCVAIVNDTGINLDNVVAATATLSAGRLWSGTANGNIETARALAKIVKDPIEIEVEQKDLDLMQWKHDKATKGVGRVGMRDHGLKAGTKVSSADLDAGTLVELMYARNATRGMKSFEEWVEKTSKNGKIGMKSTRESTKIPPPFPFFTSKGTHQVKQAVAVLRNEVTPRQSISGPKYSSFFSNIRNPDANYSSTNDTWHYRIMAGNLPITHTRKGETRTDTIDRLSMKERSPDKTAFATTQDIFQAGPASKKEGLDAGDGMFRDTTVLTKDALSRLAQSHPTQFGGMKPHEFQALIWVYYGGGQSSQGERTARWDGAREQMRKVGL